MVSTFPAPGSLPPDFLALCYHGSSDRRMRGRCCQSISDPAYQELAGIPTEAKEFVTERRQWLSWIAEETDGSVPNSHALRIENGEPILAKLIRKKMPPRLPWLEATIWTEVQQTPILDALADTENLLHWTRSFGPPCQDLTPSSRTRENATCCPLSAMAATSAPTRRRDPSKEQIVGRSLGSTSGTSPKMRSTRRSHSSLTPTITSRFRGSGAPPNTLQPTERAGTCTSRILSPSTTSATGLWRHRWRDDVDNAARILAHVWTNQLIFYKALRARFAELPRLELDPNIKIAEQAVRRLTRLFNEAAKASGDYETLLFPNTRDWANDLAFVPVGAVDALCA